MVFLSPNDLRIFQFYSPLSRSRAITISCPKATSWTLLANFIPCLGRSFAGHPGARIYRYNASPSTYTRNGSPLSHCEEISNRPRQRSFHTRLHNGCLHSAVPRGYNVTSWGCAVQSYRAFTRLGTAIEIPHRIASAFHRTINNDLIKSARCHRRPSPRPSIVRRSTRVPESAVYYWHDRVTYAAMILPPL